MTAIAISAGLFALLLAAISWAGYRYYVKPSQVYDQIGGPASEQTRLAARPAREGVVVRLVEQVGKAVPVSPQDVSMIRRQLIAAGHRGESALAIYYGLRIITAVVLVGLAFVFLLGGAAVAGYFLPSLGLDLQIKRRQETIRYALPDVLDLLVVCVDAGLGLDQAILTVAEELKHTRAPGDRRRTGAGEPGNPGGQAAFRRAAEFRRSNDCAWGEEAGGDPDPNGPVRDEHCRLASWPLRVHARAAEERANKVGVKLVFPIFFFILPAMLVVVAGPGLLQLIKELFPLMRQFRGEGLPGA